MSFQDRVLRGAPAAVSPSRATGGAASTIANWTETARADRDGQPFRPLIVEPGILRW
jgi:hypothetical protein